LIVTDFEFAPFGTALSSQSFGYALLYNVSMTGGSDNIVIGGTGSIDAIHFTCNSEFDCIAPGSYAGTINIYDSSLTATDQGYGSSKINMDGIITYNSTVNIYSSTINVSGATTGDYGVRTMNPGAQVNVYSSTITTGTGATYNYDLDNAGGTINISTDSTYNHSKVSGTTASISSVVPTIPIFPTQTYPAPFFLYVDNTPDNTNIENSGALPFTANLSSLVCGTTYHYSAYAVNSIGTSTTPDSVFTTSACWSAPTISYSSGGSSISPVILESDVPKMAPATTTTLLFTRNLQFGTTSLYVKTLQQYLNSHGFAVSSTGAGSAGHETTFFGPLTKIALSKFQKARGIYPALGYLGPITKTYIIAHP